MNKKSEIVYARKTVPPKSVLYIGGKRLRAGDVYFEHKDGGVCEVIDAQPPLTETKAEVRPEPDRV